jgi:GH18 family chitinase
VNRVRKTVPIIFGILILTGTSGFQFAPMSVQSADAVFTKKIIGYFPEWENGDVGLIDYSKLTHIIYFHIWPNNDGSLDTSAVHFDDLDTIVTNAHDAEVKVMIAVGGWGVSNGFGQMSADDTARANFVNNIVQFINEHQLDGVDIDWEPIDSETKKINQAALLSDLKTVLPDKLVTVAVNAERLDLFPSSADDVDWVNLMAYDMNWRHGEHSNFEDAVAALERYEVEGIPAEKLALGIPFYGRDLQTKAIKYEDVVATCNPEPSEDYCDNYFFNGIDLVQQKSQFVLNSNYAGVMIWNLGQDTYDDTSLLNAIYEVLDVPPPDPGPPIAYPDSYSVNAQSTLNIDAPGVLLNDIEPDGGPMTVEIFASTDNGTLNLDDDGSFVYTPISGFLGIDSFSYIAIDSDGPSNVVDVTIEVNTTPSVIEETSSGFQDRKTVTSVTTSESLLGVSNNLYLTSISVNPKMDVQSVSGMGLAWLPLESQCGALGGSQTEVWWAIGDDSTTDGAVTANLSDGAKSMIISTSRISGINSQDPFGSIVSGNNNEVNDSCSGGTVSDNYNFEVNIGNQNSMLFGAIGASYEQNGYQHSPGPGFNEIFHHVTKFSDVGLSTVQKPDLSISPTSLDGTFSQLRDWHVIGIEIKPQGLGSSTNYPPLANAGTDQDVDEGDLVTLDGTSSSDSEGTIATYAWTQTAGDSVTLDTTIPSQPTFTAPLVDAAGDTLTFSLEVTDDDGAISTNLATVDINVGNVVVTTDTVEITNADYRLRNGHLNISATSTDPSATLTVEGYGEMSTSGDGNYQLKLRSVDEPGNTITVDSSSGGTHTAPVNKR